jgi:hypothetical protein
MRVLPPDPIFTNIASMKIAFRYSKLLMRACASNIIASKILLFAPVLPVMIAPVLAKFFTLVLLAVTAPILILAVLGLGSVKFFTALENAGTLAATGGVRLLLLQK